jgi:hypothetical protein
VEKLYESTFKIKKIDYLDEFYTTSKEHEGYNMDCMGMNNFKNEMEGVEIKKLVEKVNHILGISNENNIQI